VTDWEEIENLVYIENLGNDITFDVERQGARTSIRAPRTGGGNTADKPFGIVEAQLIPVVRSVDPRTPAEKVGLKPGDVIVQVESVHVGYPLVSDMIHERAGRSINLAWRRGDQMLHGSATVTAEGRIGIIIEPTYSGPTKKIQYSLIGAFPAGLARTGEAVYLFYLTISKIVAGKTSIRDSFGGPIAIAQLASRSAQYGLLEFLGFMAMLSMSLALLNILPIPALDGGHLALMLYEKASRREIPHNVKIRIQQAGFVLLLAFMAFIIYNDLSRF
jgi:regulator of sigma E protease